MVPSMERTSSSKRIFGAELSSVPNSLASSAPGSSEKDGFHLDPYSVELAFLSRRIRPSLMALLRQGLLPVQQRNAASSEQ